MSQLHKKFTDAQVKELLARYLKGEIPRAYLEEILGIKRSRFFLLVKEYQKKPRAFSIRYERRRSASRLSEETDQAIVKELAIEKTLIQNKEVPIRSYNYSYIKDRLQSEYGHKVSLPTIIDRAKKHGFYLKKPKRSTHDREILTHYAGQLIQHDSSFHLWAPTAGEKWHLITSLDDYSRFILYAELVRRETSWDHILALQTVFLHYGLPFAYYVDSHSIFRFVQGRDSLWRDHHKVTDEVDPQWKQVLEDCGVKVTYALSPQAKGKIERPYQWLQDRLVRTCVRDNTTDLRRARIFLRQEINRYNYHQVHSTTLQVPYMRFQNALTNKKSLFRQFHITPPYQSVKDIFCLRIERTTDSYRRVSINNRLLSVNKANPHDVLTIRLHPMRNGLTELRFWREDQLLDVQILKSTDLARVHF
jgi:transposase